MSRVLIKTQEVYRVEMEEEANNLITEAQNENEFELVGYGTAKKTTKDDEYFLVTLKKKFNDEKNPKV